MRLAPLAGKQARFVPDNVVFPRISSPRPETSSFSGVLSLSGGRQARFAPDNVVFLRVSSTRPRQSRFPACSPYLPEDARAMGGLESRRLLLLLFAASLFKPRTLFSRARLPLTYSMNVAMHSSHASSPEGAEL
jgi:hypothetical protein